MSVFKEAAVLKMPLEVQSLIPLRPRGCSRSSKCRSGSSAETRAAKCWCAPLFKMLPIWISVSEIEPLGWNHVIRKHEYLLYTTMSYRQRICGTILHMGVRRYVRYVNIITASGYASGMNRGTYQVITLSVRLGAGGFWRAPVWCQIGCECAQRDQCRRHVPTSCGFADAVLIIARMIIIMMIMIY